MGHVQSDKLLIGVSAEVCDLVHSWPDESDAPSLMLALSFPILFWANLQVCLGELLCFYVFLFLCLFVCCFLSFFISFIDYLFLSFFLTFFLANARQVKC